MPDQARPIAGDVGLGNDLVERTRALWQRRARRWLANLAEATEERHERAGEIAFLLEPDLKEGKGGLRDLQAREAAALASPVIENGEGAFARQTEVLLADTMDGKPLPADAAPFRLIAPADKRPARWVRMVKRLTVVAVPD